MVVSPCKMAEKCGLTVKNGGTWWFNNEKMVEHGGLTIKNRTITHDITSISYHLSRNIVNMNHFIMGI